MKLWSHEVKKNCSKRLLVTWSQSLFRFAMKNDCNGCFFNHPSQVQHECIMVEDEEEITCLYMDSPRHGRLKEGIWWLLEAPRVAYSSHCPWCFDGKLKIQDLSEFKDDNMVSKMHKLIFLIKMNSYACYELLVTAYQCSRQFCFKFLICIFCWYSYLVRGHFHTE